jgi:hypothetical protein
MLTSCARTNGAKAEAAGARELVSQKVIVARVGDATITVDQLEEEMLKRKVSSDPDRSRELLWNLIRFEALAQEANRLGYGGGPGVRKQEMIQRLIAGKFGERPSHERLEQFVGDVRNKTAIEVHEDVLSRVLVSYEKILEAKVFLLYVRDHIASWRLGHGTGDWTYPPSTDWTPPTPCCSYPSQLCPADIPKQEQAFSAVAWRTFDFAIYDPFHYQYRFVSSGRGRTAAFRLEAQAGIAQFRRSEVSSSRATRPRTGWRRPRSNR